MGKHTYHGEKSIEPLKSDIDKAELMLTEYYTDIAHGTPAQIAVKVEEVINKAKWGWYRCKYPETLSNEDISDAFHNRIQFLMGSKSSRLEKLKRVRAAQAREDQGHVAAGLDMMEHLSNRNVFLDADEKAYMQKRYKEYMEDFDFNISSDRVLLNQVIVDEVVLHRLEIERLDRRKGVGEAFEYEGLMKDILERYRRNIDLLGVSRKQRAEYDDSIEGNVAALSVNVEEKLDRIKQMSNPEEKQKLIEEYTQKYTGITKEELEDYINEVEMQRKWDMFPEKNFVSETELLGQDSYDEGMELGELK